MGDVPHLAGGLSVVFEDVGYSGLVLRRADAERSVAWPAGLILLLDGLDEVPRELRAAAEELLSDLAQKWPKSPIVVTTRPIGAGDLGPEYRVLEVLPFDDELRRSFLAQWFGHEGEPDTGRADTVASTLEADHNLRDLTSNPLYLTLIALLIEQGDEPARHRSRLFARRSLARVTTHRIRIDALILELGAEARAAVEHHALDVERDGHAGVVPVAVAVAVSTGRAGECLLLLSDALPVALPLHAMTMVLTFVGTVRRTQAKANRPLTVCTAVYATPLVVAPMLAAGLNALVVGFFPTVTGSMQLTLGALLVVASALWLSTQQRPRLQPHAPPAI